MALSFLNAQVSDILTDLAAHFDPTEYSHRGSDTDRDCPSDSKPYWDCKQLIEQVKTKAILLFEEAHLGCQALFIFDQSSAHAALPPDALKAFEMNKYDGGKQRCQKDTIIPDTNPYPEFRGKVQKMTTEPGEQKGLQQTLGERGFDVTGKRAKCSPDDFSNQVSMLETLIKDAGHECIFLPKFQCELNPIEMYWRWVKYRYRQVHKKMFEDAKQAALTALDSCPVNVIRRFINRSWRFMEAYRVPLYGKAAA
ncbi:hypothetical protein GALMADRAFT_137026 [Galerina marginata CBS 339.88]|uniref:Tc1-like transposase DDE domain-containing protein n=1 Tax=Galerina marginata (strain CBS 339.88) TaxID=685588 RepID=A0A067TGU5_GALM3|nr:hypothetical protein GALMADRAFT_137026 [Galerina marginata CBS 339.88]